MSHFTPSIALRLGYNNLWKFNWYVGNIAALDLYLKLKYFFLKNNMLLLYYKIYRLNNKAVLYIVYFKFKKIRPIKVKWYNKMKIWPNANVFIKVNYYKKFKTSKSFFLKTGRRETLTLGRKIKVRKKRKKWNEYLYKEKKTKVK